MDCYDEILADVLTRIPRLGWGCAQGEHDAYWQEVATWLGALPVHRQTRWEWRLVATISATWNLHPEFAAYCLERALREAARKGVCDASEL